MGAVAAACEFRRTFWPAVITAVKVSRHLTYQKKKNLYGLLRRRSLAEVGQDINGVGFFTVAGSLGLWGCREARRAAARPTRPGAHVRRGGGGRPTSRGYRVGRGRVPWSGPGGFGAQARAAMCRPTRGGEGGPLGTSCVRGKMAALRPCCRELKMEDAAARESGRVSHPHKGKGPFPLRPLLPVTPRCTGRRLGTSVPQLLGSRPPSEGGGDFMRWS